MSTKPCHHPDAELLVGTASGALSPAMTLLVSAHGAMCPVCGEELRRYDMIGGALMESMAPADMSDGALDSVMALLDGGANGPSLGTQAVSLTPPEDGELSLLPEPVRTLARDAMRSGKDWSFVYPGLKTLVLDGGYTSGDAGTIVRLVRTEPGTSSPKHTHDDMEYTLVLTGAFRDQTGLYGPGDVAVASPDVIHNPVTEPGDVCIALSVTTGPVRFTGALGLLQRMMGKS